MSGGSHKSGSLPDPPTPGPDRHAGSIKESSAVFRQGLAEHLKARAELLDLEVREAGEVAARKGLLGLVIAFLLFFTYALLLTAVVAFLGFWLKSVWPDPCAALGWPLAALVIGGLHLLLAFILFTKLKRKPDQKLFEFTRAEFQKDRQWLTQTTDPPPSESDSSR